MTQVVTRIVLVVHTLACFAAAAAAGESATQPRPSDAPEPAHASLWGTAERGLQVRLVGPAQVEAGMPLRMSVAFVADPDRLPRAAPAGAPATKAAPPAGGELPAADRLDTYLFAGYVSLTLTNAETGASFSIRPHDPTLGMPAWDPGNEFVVLGSTPGEPISVDFPLLAAGEGLKPGTYDCTVTYDSAQGDPLWRPRPSAGTERFWTGKVASAPLRVRVAPETPHRRSFTVPTTLRLADGKVRFDKTEAAQVDLPVRNGCYTGMRVNRAGGMQSLGSDGFAADGAVVDDPTPNPATGDVKAEALHYEIEIFETPRRPVHMWMPGPGVAGYKTLWRHTFDVKPAGAPAPRKP